MDGILCHKLPDTHSVDDTDDDTMVDTKEREATGSLRSVTTMATRESKQGKERRLVAV